MKSNPQHDTREAYCKWTGQAMADAVIAAIAFLVGLAVMISSYRIGAGWADGNLQSGYFPFRLGVIISFVSLLILLRALFSTKRDDSPFVRWDELRRVLAVLIPTVVYIFATQFIGIYVASALFIGTFMRVGSRYGWLKTLTVSIGTSAILFLLFEIVFLVPLPKGPLEAILGY